MFSRAERTVVGRGIGPGPRAGPPSIALVAVLLLAAILLTSALFSASSLDTRTPVRTATATAVSPPGSGATTPPAVPAPLAVPEGDSPPIGSIVSTVDLVSDQALPGRESAPLQSTPADIHYDSLNGELYLRSGTGAIQFSALDGTYPFSIPSVTGYSAAPSAGTLPVSGAPATQPIAFTAVSGTLTVTLTATPSTVTLGNGTRLTASVTGGVAPFAYAYTGLPEGCTTVNSSSFECTPAVAGLSTVTVTVTDHLGHSAQATASLTVQVAPGASPASTPGGIPIWVYPVVVVLILLPLIIFLLVPRRKKEPVESAPPTPPPEPPW
jgi:hypothetical protein